MRQRGVAGLSDAHVDHEAGDVSVCGASDPHGVVTVAEAALERDEVSLRFGVSDLNGLISPPYLEDLRLIFGLAGHRGEQRRVEEADGGDVDADTEELIVVYSIPNAQDRRQAGSGKRERRSPSRHVVSEPHPTCHP
jgi:hypothetical protein